jgi:transglutaminase-like putative cysteine protease
VSLLRVEHVTEYTYANRVELAGHLLHLRPRSLPWQDVRRFQLRADPEPDRVQWGTDHFGNPVAWLFLDRAHDSLRVSTEALVRVEPREPPVAQHTPAWEMIARMARQPASIRQVAEFSFGSERAPATIRPDNPARAYTLPSFPPDRPVLEGLVDLMQRMGRDFRFDANVTTVSTPVERVLELRAGVCQDFAHLMIAGLRALGLPARYVSGYLRTLPPPGRAKLRGADASHAWVSAWLGPELGWIDLDPTNNVIVSDGHVWLGWGRDFADVSPIQGILLGGGRHTLHVAVDIEPENEAVPVQGTAFG